MFHEEKVGGSNSRQQEELVSKERMIGMLHTQIKKNKEFIMSYVDGFVIPIPKNKLNAYKKMAKFGC